MKLGALYKVVGKSDHLFLERGKRFLFWNVNKSSLGEEEAVTTLECRQMALGRGIFLSLQRSLSLKLLLSHLLTQVPVFFAQRALIKQKPDNVYKQALLTLLNKMAYNVLSKLEHFGE